MYVGRDYDVFDVGENEVFALDFINDLALPDSIISADWVCTAIEGTDPLASARPTGAPFILGTTVSIRLTGLLPGVRYRVQCKASTANGDLKSLYSHVRCMEPA